MNNSSVQQRDFVSLKDKICYGICDFGNTIFFDLGQIYLLKYYTDALNIPPIYAGGVFLFTKVFDAIVDMSVGAFIDKCKVKNPKRGRYRPFIIYFSAPLGLITIACFVNPFISLSWQLIWAYVTYMLFGVFYSLVNIPYGAMAASMTKDLIERTKLASWRTGMGQFGDMIAIVVVLPLATILPFGSHSFTAAIIIIAIICTLASIVSFIFIKEKVNLSIVKRNNEASFSDGFKAVIRNRPILLLCIANICIFSAFNVKLAVQIYFCQYFLHNAHIVSYMGLCSFVCVLIGVSCAPKLVKIFGKKNTYLLGCAIFAVGDICNFSFTSSAPSFIAFACVTFLGYSIITSLTWSFVPDAVEYGEWKTGLRTESMVYSFFVFFRKLSQAVAGIVPGIVLSLVGYVPNTTQSLQALFGFRLLMFIYPSTLVIVALLVWYFFYNLDDSFYKRIITDLARKSLTKE